MEKKYKVEKNLSTNLTKKKWIFLKQMKRKMDDVSKKLDVLYELISRVQLSENALQLLSEMANHLRNSDYKSALNIYTKMVSGPDFSQIATFMPGIKMLIQNASQLRIVYC